MVEFALVAPIFFTILFGVIEMGRVMNAWVTLHDICLDGAAWSSRPDPTLSRGPYEVLDYIGGELDKVPWVTNLRSDARGCFVTVDVNNTGVSGMFETRVRIRMSLEPLVGPNPERLGMPLYTIDVQSEIENVSKSLGGNQNNERLEPGTSNPWTEVTSQVADMISI